jgi:hypothetical protein
MSEGKHTPGPWLLEVDKSMRGEWVIRSPSDNSLMGNADYYPWQSGNIYDAHLIAAAPDMLKALEQFVEEYVELVNSGDAGFWNPEDEDKVKFARAAISKAKGINPDE